MSHHAHSCHECISFIKLVLVKNLILDLINTFLSETPSAGEYHSDDWLTKDLNQGGGSRPIIRSNRLTIFGIVLVELFPRCVLRRIV